MNGEEERRRLEEGEKMRQEEEGRTRGEEERRREEDEARGALALLGWIIAPEIGFIYRRAIGLFSHLGD